MGLIDNFKMAFGMQGDASETSTELVSMQDSNFQETSRIISRGAADVARVIGPRKVTFHEDWFKLNEVFCRVMFMEGWPVEVSPNWLRPLFQWQRPIDIMIYYKPLPTQDYIKMLRTKSSREMSELAKDERERNPIDYERVQRLQDSMQLQELLQRQESKPFQIGLLMLIRGETKQELDELTMGVTKALDGMGARCARADLIQKDAFLSMMPFGRNYIDDSFTTRNMHTEAAAVGTFPLANADLAHPDGVWFGINKSTNSNVILDRFKLQSPHSLILGASGSGKSMAAKLEILRSLMHRIPCMVIDPEGEFERMARYTGGVFINVSPSSADRINALDFSSVADGQEDHLTPKILSVMRLLGTMVNPEGKSFGLTAQQVEILEGLLRALYADFGYTSNPQTQIPEELGGHCRRERMPVLSDLRARISAFIDDHEGDASRVEPMKYIMSAMRPYCAGGLFAGLFDQRTTIKDLRTAHLVVFNIKELTKDAHLMNLGMHTVLDFVQAQVMTKAQQLSGQRRLLFVDEAHVMMRNAESADFLQDVMRRARKYGVGVTILSQDPDDFVRADRPQGRAIIQNSSLQLVLRMKRKSLELLQDIMGLGEVEIDWLSICNTGEGMVFAMNDRALLSMHTASQREYEMITTNADEVALIEARHQAQLPAAGQTSTPAPVSVVEQLMVKQEQIDRNMSHTPRVATIPPPEPVAQIGPPISREPSTPRRSGPPAPAWTQQSPPPQRAYPDQPAPPAGPAPSAAPPASSPPPVGAPSTRSRRRH